MEVNYYRKVGLNHSEIRKMWKLPSYNWNGSGELHLLFNLYSFMTAYSDNVFLLDVWRKHFSEKEVLSKFYILKNEKLVDIEYEAFNTYNFIFQTTKENLDKIQDKLNKKRKWWHIFKENSRSIGLKHNNLLIKSNRQNKNSESEIPPTEA